TPRWPSFVSCAAPSRSRQSRPGECRSTSNRATLVQKLVQFRRPNMEHPVAPLFCRPWTINNMSPRLIESHYEHNYGGAVTRLNAIEKELEALDPATTRPDVYGRLKRDQIAALNAMLLHELYFASLGGDGRTVPEGMAGPLAQSFGSVDRWRHEFIALAGSLAGGSGWTLLSWLPRDRRL